MGITGLTLKDMVDIFEQYEFMKALSIILFQTNLVESESTTTMFPTTNTASSSSSSLLSSTTASQTSTVTKSPATTGNFTSTLNL